MSIRFQYRAEVEAVAPRHHLDPDLVTTVCLVESSGNTRAYRYEPGFWLKYMAHKPQWAGMDPMIVSASYGLMQVMYPVAREFGYPATDPPEQLYIPAIGLEYGCRVLADRKAWAKGDVPATLAAYNGGKSKDNRPEVEPKRNQRYVDKVLGILDQIRRGEVTW